MPRAPIIACIDDDRPILEALQDFFKASGFDTLGFSSAEAFLESEGLTSASFLITDLKLGGMSGIQLLRHVAVLGITLPAILITAFADEHVRTEAFAAGALAVMSKPVVMDALLASVGSAARAPVPRN